MLLTRRLRQQPDGASTDIERPADVAISRPGWDAFSPSTRADTKPQEHSPSDGQGLPHCERVHVRDVTVAAY